MLKIRNMVNNDFIRKYCEKYKTLSLPLKAAFWFTVCSFIEKAFSMITTPIFTRILNQSEYGVVNVYSSWKTMMDCFLTLCLSSCTMRLYIDYKSDEKKVLTAVTSLELIIMGFWTLMCVLFGESISLLTDMPSLLCLCLVINVTASQVMSLWMGYKRFFYDYKKIILVTLLNTVGSCILSIVVVLGLSRTGTGRIVPQVLVSSLIAMFLVFNIFKKNSVFCDLKIWKIAFKVGIPYIFINLSHFILGSSDTIMINHFCDSQKVALYGMTNSVGSIIGILTASINMSLDPYCFQLLKDEKYDNFAKRINEIMILVGFFLVGIILYGREIILVFAGENYLESASILFPICVGIYFNYMVTHFARIQTYYYNNTILVLLTTACAIINITLNFVFIPLIGYKVAAYTTLTSYLSFFALHLLVYYLKGFENKKILDIKGFIKWTIIFVSLCIVASLAANYFIAKILIGSIGAVLAFLFRKQLAKYARKLL